jgi:ApaG protein
MSPLPKRLPQFNFPYDVTKEKGFDWANNIEIVDGEGVIGKKPVLKPGEKHTYNSGCLLSSPFGAMSGYFNMINFTTTKTFKVIVPTFKLSAPFALN